MDVQLPDGTVITDVPEGTRQSDLMARVAKMRSPTPAPDAAVAVNSANKGLAGIPDALLNTPSNIINLGKAAYGMGAKAIGREDLMPFADTPNPNLAGRAMSAMGFTSEANDPKNAKQRVIGAMVQGGVGAAVTPSRSVAQLVKNVAMGEAGGAAGGATKEATGSDALAISAGLLTSAAPSAAARVISGTPKPMNDVKAKTLADAEAIDYRVPPSEKTDSFVGNRLEGIAGKAALKQEATIRNQSATNEAANADLGFPKGTALTEGKLDSYRDTAAKPYREVAALSKTAASALDELKQARYDAKVYGRHADMSGDPQSVAKAKQAQSEAAQWEQVIESEAARLKKPALVSELREARQQIAKSYDIERNLNLGDANVSGPGLGRALDKGIPLSGNVKTAAAFAEAFPKYAGEGGSVPTPGVSKSEAISSAILATMGAGAVGPVGLMAGGLPFVSSPTRAMLLSEPYQKMIGNAGKGNPDAAMRSLMLARAIAERKGTQ